MQNQAVSRKRHENMTNTFFTPDIDLNDKTNNLYWLKTIAVVVGTFESIKLHRIQTTAHTPFLLHPLELHFPETKKRLSTVGRAKTGKGMPSSSIARSVRQGRKLLNLPSLDRLGLQSFTDHLCRLPLPS